jgi:hypothetical protein
MNNRKLIALLAVIFLFGLSVIFAFFIPKTRSHNIQNIIEGSLVILLVWYFTMRYFANWYRRKTAQLTDAVQGHSNWILIFGLVLLGISLSSIILVPTIWPNLSATGARMALIIFIVTTFPGCVLVVQWLVMKH